MSEHTGLLAQSVQPAWAGHLNQADDITLNNGERIEYSSFTGNVNAGLSLQFTNGGTLNLTAAADGLGGDVQVYSGGVRFSIPLN